MVLVLLVNKKIPTHFEIITCDHFATEFHEKFQDMIVQENFDLDSTCLFQFMIHVWRNHVFVLLKINIIAFDIC